MAIPKIWNLTVRRIPLRCLHANKWVRILMPVLSICLLIWCLTRAVFDPAIPTCDKQAWIRNHVCKEITEDVKYIKSSGYQTDTNAAVNDENETTTNRPTTPRPSDISPYDIDTSTVPTQPPPKKFNWTSYKDALEAQVEVKGFRRLVFIAQVDEGFLDMAINFYMVSLRPNRIENFLFIGLTDVTCSRLQEEQLPCYVYRAVTTGTRASVFGSRDFLAKMNIRTEMIIEALELGYWLIHTDVDNLFFKNPTYHIPCGGRCHLTALMDGTDYNAGFIFLRPSTYTINVYKRMKELAVLSPKMDDQDQLTREINRMKREDRRFVALQLNTDTFQSGRRYFEEGNRTFIGDEGCPRCIVAHNNWIVSYAAKVYRFKELHYWMIDRDQYYSSGTRRYLRYGNPLVFDDRTQLDRSELHALRNGLALALSLNRTLILPKFHCKAGDIFKDCALNSKIKVSTFDEYFAGHYREHTFISHEFVPYVYKSNPGIEYAIMNEESQAAMPKLYGNPFVIKYFPGQTPGATAKEIKDWFGENLNPVLRFNMLYGQIIHFEDPELQEIVSDKLVKGLKPSNYRQTN